MVEGNTHLSNDGVMSHTAKVQGAYPLANSTEFDPFRERKLDNPTTDYQTLIHLIKSTLGSGVMAMPYAFKTSGIIGGILGGLLMAAICTHTAYILIDCAHKLYYKTRKTKMDYADVAEAAFTSGPKSTRKYAKCAGYFVKIWLFATYFGACSADNLLISTNFGQVIKYYKHKFVNTNISGADNVTATNTSAAVIAMAPVEYDLLRTIMGCLIFPLILLVWIPDLKYLAPISIVANIFMACVIGITCFYLVQNPIPVSKLPLFQPITNCPQFLSIALFAMENIGVIMPLENNMKTPRNILGQCGVLNKAMIAIAFVHLLLGVLGYMKYGDKVNMIITTNLPVTDVAAQIVKVLIGATVLFTFSLQFYVCREIVWMNVKKYFPNKPLLAEYTIRALLVIACVMLAIALPMIGPLVTLVGALGFSFLGIIAPVIIETITYWNIGFGQYNWKIYKNILLIIFGVLSLVCGSHYAIQDIIHNMLQR